ncbi:hypothetical protein BpHYR1_046009 [Brachionus plicatilis]|uniref:Uncharacterized protein n=1 Tax=Brachionus plicatilis TaxID=10195 RepID=A0A3M7Q1S6_BRAPC|nr:hypothetical protein BpHYR1_046009 [Brachionus plicatilis]
MKIGWLCSSRFVRRPLARQWRQMNTLVVHCGALNEPVFCIISEKCQKSCSAGFDAICLDKSYQLFHFHFHGIRTKKMSSFSHWYVQNRLTYFSYQKPHFFDRKHFGTNVRQIKGRGNLFKLAPLNSIDWKN